MSSCTAEKTLKASGIFKKRYRLFNRTKYYSRVIHGHSRCVADINGVTRNYRRAGFEKTK